MPLHLYYNNMQLDMDLPMSMDSDAENEILGASTICGGAPKWKS